MKSIWTQKNNLAYPLTWVCTAAVVVPVLLFSGHAEARGGTRYFDISLNGSYQSNIQKYQTSTRRSLGIELGLPLTDILDISFGHTQIIDRDVYNDLYRETKKSQGIAVPDGDIEEKTQIIDSVVNAQVGYPFNFIRPVLFGGALKRRSCFEDTFQDYGCTDHDVTWNAGIGVTISRRFRVTYRISPSVSQESGKKKNYDELTSIGLTWSL